MSLPEIDLARYERECDRAFSEEEYINDRIAWYMRDGGSCDPYCAESFLGALEDTDKELQEALHPLLKAEKLDYWAIGKTICDWVQKKCEDLAQQMAEDDLEREKEYD